VASEAGHVEIVHLLLEKGANANARTNEGKTPLHMASMRGWLEVAKLLFKYGADVNGKDADHWTPLHFALEYNWTGPKVALWLIELVVDVNSEDNDGYTPLHFASVKGNLEVVRSLLKRGANLDARDKNGKAPFQLAPEAIRRYLGPRVVENVDIWDSIPSEADANVLICAETV
jgi:ankyrin repeat protein